MHDRIQQPLAILALLIPLVSALPVHAQQTTADEFTLTGSVTGVSQYRLRGVSVSDETPALQASLTATHKSGFYAGLWGSSLKGFGTYGGADMELDAIGGYSRALGSATVDGGLVVYTFPGTHGHTYTELFASISQPIGPVNTKFGLNYAPKRQSIGNADHLYTYADLTLPLQDLPMTLKAHLGYTTGPGSIYAGPAGHYFDYSVGAEFAWRMLNIGLSYVGTSINNAQADAFYTVPGGKRGRSLVDDAFVLSIGVTF